MTMGFNGAERFGLHRTINTRAGKQTAVRTTPKAAVINKLMERARAEMAVGLPFEVVNDVYKDLPLLVRRAAGMLFIPSHFKAGKIYGMAPRPRKNLLQYSQRFEVSPWVSSGTTITPNATIAPDGTLTADRLVETNSGSQVVHFRGQTVQSAGAGVYTASIYIKASERTSARVAVYNASLAGQSVHYNINLILGTISFVQATPLMEAVNCVVSDEGNGWRRVAVTVKSLVNQGIAFLTYALEGTANNYYIGDITKGIYLWGAQLEKGSVATTYEPTNASENLLKYSEQFDNAVWVKSASTVGVNTTTAPDGTLTADKLIADATSTTAHNFNQSFTVGNGTFTFSAYLKFAGMRYCRVAMSDGSTARLDAFFDLQTGTKGSSANGGSWTGTASDIVSVGDGWYRCSITSTKGAGTTIVPSIYVDGTFQGSGIATTGNGVDGIYVWGAQLNYGSTALPYTKTTYSNTDGWVDHADFTFSRNSNAMVVGKDGLLQYAPHNLHQRSEEFDNAIWTKLNVNITSNVAIAPDGTLTADKLAGNNVAGNHYVDQFNTTVTAGQIVTISGFVKAAESTSTQIQFCNSSVWGGSAPTATVNLLNGSYVVNTGTPTVTVIAYPDGWYRVGITATAVAAGNTGLRLYADNGTSAAHTNGVYIWGGMMNIGSRLLDYVQTTSAAVYAPRFQYHPVTKKYEGLLMEKASTNLLTYSEDFTQAVYGKTRATITPNIIVAPDGQSTADRFEASVTDGNGSWFYQGQTLTASSTYTLSVFAKAGTSNFIVVDIYDNTAAASRRVWFNLGTGLVGTDGAAGSGLAFVSKSVTPHSDGWYRCSVTVTIGTNTSIWSILRVCDADGSLSVTAGKYVYIWGAQLEQSSVPTSYIPTLGASATRAVETCNNSNVANWMNETEGTIYTNVAFTTLPNAFAPVISINDGAGSNRHTIQLDNTNKLNGSTVYNGTTEFYSSVGSTLLPNSMKKVTYAYKTNDCMTSVEGLLGVVDSTTNMPSVNQVNLCATATVMSQLAIIKAIAYFPTRRTNSELQQLTR